MEAALSGRDERLPLWRPGAEKSHHLRATIEVEPDSESPSMAMQRTMQRAMTQANPSRILQEAPAMRSSVANVDRIANALLDLAFYEKTADASDLARVCEFLRTHGEHPGETVNSLRARDGIALAIRIQAALDEKARPSLQVVK
jgi:hypothetical protein